MWSDGEFVLCCAKVKHWFGDRNTRSSLMRQQTAAEPHQHFSHTVYSSLVVSVGSRVFRDERAGAEVPLNHRLKSLFVL